jgi:malate synthase
VAATGGSITETGLRTNIHVGIRYIASWLDGTGAAAIHNLMEDAATAEISRGQVWQWVHHNSVLDDGRAITEELVKSLIVDELVVIAEEIGAENFAAMPFDEAREIFQELALSDDFEEFLTIPAYKILK